MYINLNPKLNILSVPSRSALSILANTMSSSKDAIEIFSDSDSASSPRPKLKPQVRIHVKEGEEDEFCLAANETTATRRKSNRRVLWMICHTYLNTWQLGKSVQDFIESRNVLFV
jgi:hypothetical protein